MTTENNAAALNLSSLKIEVMALMPVVEKPDSDIVEHEIKVLTSNSTGTVLAVAKDNAMNLTSITVERIAGVSAGDTITAVINDEDVVVATSITPAKQPAKPAGQGCAMRESKAQF